MRFSGGADDTDSDQESGKNTLAISRARHRPQQHFSAQSFQYIDHNEEAKDMREDGSPDRAADRRHKSVERRPADTSDLELTPSDAGGSGRSSAKSSPRELRVQARGDSPGTAAARHGGASIGREALGGAQPRRKQALGANAHGRGPLKRPSAVTVAGHFGGARRHAGSIYHDPGRHDARSLIHARLRARSSAFDLSKDGSARSVSQATVVSVLLLDL